MARVRRARTSSLGILLEILGVILLFIVPVGTIIGIILLIVGGNMNIKYVCSECENPVASKHVKLCPVCKAVLR